MVFNFTDTLHKLSSYKDSSYPIISLYLTIPDHYSSLYFAQKFQKLVKNTLSGKEQKAISEDLLYIDSFLHQDKGFAAHRGIAIFSGGNRLFETITTPFSLSDKLVISHAPYLLPIYKELNAYKRYLILVADREKAKMLTYYLGEIEEETELSDPSVPQRVKGRNLAMRSGKVDRHIRDHLNRHFKLIAQKTTAFARGKKISGVFLGSHKEILHNLKKSLPKKLQNKIAGEFISGTHVSASEIRKKVHKLFGSHFDPQQAL